MDSILSEISNFKNDTDDEKFKEYKNKINKLKERLKYVSNAELKEKITKLQGLFQDKLAAKLAALKLAKQTIEGLLDEDNAKQTIWKEAKLVGVTIKFRGSNASGKGEQMSKEAVEQIDKIIKFLEESTN
ncbi:fibronectin-binding protein RevA [Borreliella valaisiana]|uniref:fibronectin-binding protein RevA n=1 Tax=Borreliella valaisiana TaxID=62088 RepID=UPI002E180163